MHHEAYQFIQSRVQPSVLEIGSRNINGSIRSLFPQAKDYLGVDLYPGPGVDLVADATVLRLGRRFDIVVCCEVLEHVKEWRAIIETSFLHLNQYGYFLGTCAGDGRTPHSMLGNPLSEDDTEHYRNVTVDEMKSELSKYYKYYEVRQIGTDLQWSAHMLLND